jgi:hypothetical protein
MAVGQRGGKHLAEEDAVPDEHRSDSFDDRLAAVASGFEVPVGPGCR